MNSEGTVGAIEVPYGYDFSFHDIYQVLKQAGIPIYLLDSEEEFTNVFSKVFTQETLKRVNGFENNLGRSLAPKSYPEPIISIIVVYSENCRHCLNFQTQLLRVLEFALQLIRTQNGNAIGYTGAPKNVQIIFVNGQPNFQPANNSPYNYNMGENVALRSQIFISKLALLLGVQGFPSLFVTDYYNDKLLTIPVEPGQDMSYMRTKTTLSDVISQQLNMYRIKNT